MSTYIVRPTAEISVPYTTAREADDRAPADRQVVVSQVARVTARGRSKSLRPATHIEDTRAYRLFGTVEASAKKETWKTYASAACEAEARARETGEPHGVYVVIGEAAKPAKRFLVRSTDHYLTREEAEEQAKRFADYSGDTFDVIEAFVVSTVEPEASLEDIAAKLSPENRRRLLAVARELATKESA